MKREPSNEIIELDYRNGELIVRYNPCLNYVPQWDDHDSVADRMTIAPERGADGRIDSDASALFPTEALTELVKALAEAIFQSTQERNPADFAFQQLLMRASVHLADTADSHGHNIPALPISVRTAGPRGMFVSIPSAMGMHSFVAAVEDFVGTGSASFDVDTPTGQPIRVNRLKSLTVEFPPNGSPRRFVKTLLRKLDGVVITGFADEVRGAFHRNPEDCAHSLAALGIQQNLGVLLITGITAKAMAQSGAPLVLMELGQFATLTGIPVVCVGTPGAAASLVELGVSAASLYSHGACIIEPFGKEDPHWELYSEYTWQNYFADAFGAARPDWFVREMFTHCAGHTDLLFKLGRHVRDMDKGQWGNALTPEALNGFARKALVMECKALALVAMVKQKAKVSRVTAMRFADWLPIDSAMMLIAPNDEPMVSALLLPVMGEAS
ncbi:hypothetical protein [Paraburkholderia sp. J41]|uniref:hypothetical protein n=1 Tax=Paraburkholderia sp. J41 TaxID=2805433 RepID=UPI002AC36DFE|nr:hypothetical protein [Paraburkholderia sp. J41]